MTEEVWQKKRDRRGVTEEAWQKRHGRRGVAEEAWQKRRGRRGMHGRRGVAEEAWQKRHGRTMQNRNKVLISYCLLREMSVSKRRFHQGKSICCLWE